MIELNKKVVIKSLASVIIFISYAYYQAVYLHSEFSYWYLYILLPLIPWYGHIKGVNIINGTKAIIDKTLSNMKAVITIGAFWGFISIWLVPRRISGGTSLELAIQRIPDIIQIPLSLPVYLIMKSGIFETRCTYACFEVLFLIPLGILLSTVLGAFIGYGVSKIYIRTRKE